jgi:ATP-binding cassette subfamily F protein 3
VDNSLDGFPAQPETIGLAGSRRVHWLSSHCTFVRLASHHAVGAIFALTVLLPWEAAMLLDINRIRKSYGPRDVLADVSFRLNPGEKVGLVGRNGSGKTTLLAIVAGVAEPDAGHVRRSPPSMRVGYLPQAIHAQDARTVREELASLDLAASGWWKAEKVASGLGFQPAQWEQPVASLSGGEKTRLSLAKLLLLEPDVLLLDEPTNHLDIPMLQWLERWVDAFGGAAIIASHDRRFLDATVGRVLELHDAALTAYAGNYSAYARQKELALRREAAAYREQQREIQSIQEFIQRQLQIASRIQGGPKRGRDYHGRIAKKVARRAQAGRKRLDRIERVAAPRDDPSVYAAFDQERRSGQDVVAAERISKRYGAKLLFADLDLYIRRGERLAVVGANGAGKTTLLRVLLGRESPDTGSVRLGVNVVPGYLAQEHEQLRFDRTVLDEVLSVGDTNQTDVRTLLACLLFRGADAFKRVGDLSEGERVRVALAKLLASSANLLVLDEPTNHLDIVTRERIEAALHAYGGTIILVSHDRYLLDRLSERTLLIEKGSTAVYPGNYSYVHDKRTQA